MIELLLTTLEKIYNSIKYNGFYIFLALVFPLIIYKFDAGEEIIISMTETAFWPNFLLSVSAFAALSYAVWCIPTLAIKFFQFVALKGKNRNKEEKLCLFKQLVYVYNGLGESDSISAVNEAACVSIAKKRLLIPMRYFSILPWVLYIATCVKVFFPVDYIWGITAAVMVLLWGLVFLIDYYKKQVARLGNSLLTSKKTNTLRPGYLVIVPAIMLLAIIIAWLLFALQKNSGLEDTNKVHQWIVIISHSITLLLFYSFLIFMENSRFDKATAYKISNLSYKSAILFVAACIVAFYFANESQAIGFISPVNVIMIISTAMIIFFEFFFTSQHMLITIVQKACSDDITCILKPADNQQKSSSPKERLRGYRYILYIALLALVYQFFFSSLNEHRIRVEDAASSRHPQRESLTAYFDRWLRNHPIAANDPVVYLISGQGGGSRAAAHFFMTMAKLQQADPNFFNKVFCISTASGSSSGAEMFLASRFYQKELKDSSAIAEKGKMLYGKNYMSSAFFGMLVGDGIEYFTSRNSSSVHDRNYHLQKEEMSGFAKAFGITKDSFFEKDYMQVYQDTNRHWPLFMINSTVVDHGVRGIYSPVLTGFSLARDLYGDFTKDNCNDKKYLPLVTCVNQSQAFPLLSAYNYQECTGRLADGGVVENTGCATTLEVYEALRKHCYNNKKKVTFICLNLYNSSLDPDFDAPFKNASILNTVTAAAQSPFSGSQFYAYKNLSLKIEYLKGLGPDINPRDAVIDFSLDASVTLTRTLSKKSVDSIFHNINGLGQPLPNRWHRFINSIREIDSSFRKSGF